MRISRLLAIMALCTAGAVGCSDSGEGGTPEPSSVCGDGEVSGSETCDDGNTVSGDGCSATCTDEGSTDPEICDDGIDNDGDGAVDCDDNDCDDNAACAATGVCGDGTVDAGEECDDGNTTDGDGCAADCTTEPAPECGDGNVDDGEECDDGNTEDGDGCAADCTIEPFCGDGTVDDGETCDDGNTEDGDGCAADCTIEPFCGDGNLDDGEGCDDGNNNDNDGCAADCTIEEAPENCGDGTVDEDEECDDSNTDNGDGCSAVCTIEPFCGDGNLDDGEACDDGNNDDNDGCSAACEIETPAEDCGNGTLDDGEECDDGNNEGGDGCSSVCTNEIPPAVCGNGTVEEGEICDDGELNSDTDADACRTDCTFAACGDGVVDTGEDCDGGDSCNDDCTIIPGCGNGFIDEGETCDDGIENSDLIPDACRSTCQVASCGDSVTDAGEECDNGADNGTGECTIECRIDVAAACDAAVDFVVLADEATPTAAGLRYDGSFEGTTDDSAPTTGCADEVETAEDVLLVFNAPADGDYRVSTNTLSNVADTVVYQLSNCVDGVPGICNDNDLDAAGSTIYLEGLTAGSSVFLVVDKVVGSPNDFNLTITGIAGIAAEGEDCSASDVFCEEGLLCVDGTCESNSAPVITDIETVSVSGTAVQQVIRGTDSNGDVVDWVAPTATMRDGEVLLDLAVVGEPFVEVEGDNFVIEFGVDFGGLNASGPETITYQVFDERGNLSNEFEVTVPEFVPPTTDIPEGDPCDIDRLVNVCADPFTCTADDAGTTVCGTAEAPVLSEVRSERTAADGIRVFVSGRDSNADVVSINLDALDRDGNVLDDGIGGFIEDINFPLDNNVTGDIEFEGFVALVGGLFSAESEMASIRVSVIDASGLESNEVVGNFDAPTPVGLNAECDLEGITSACTAEFDCSPNADGGATCLEPAAPTLTSIEAFYTDETNATIRYEVVGSDVNADVNGMTIEVVFPDGGSGPIAIPEAQLVPSPLGRTAFAFSFEIGSGGLAWTDTTVFLTDARGQNSEVLSDALFTEGELGAPCTTDGTGGACDTDLNLVCGAAGDDGLNRCEEAVAPVFLGLTAERIDADNVRFFLNGSDANGDVVSWRGTLLDETGADLLGADLDLAIDEDIRGIVEFNVPSTIGGFTIFPEATRVEMNLLDSTGLVSEARLSVAVPPLRLDGEACIGDGVTDLCEDGTDCIEGFCAGAAPEIIEVSAVQEDGNTRLLNITTLGTDANEDIATITFNFFDDEGTNVLGGPIDLTPSEAEPVTIVYEDGEFESTETLNWNFPEILGVSSGSVLVTDSLGATSEVVEFTFRPTLGVLEPCDVLEEADICRAGLFCDDSGEEPLCDIDTLDACEGVPTISATDEGEFVEGEGLYVAFDTNGNDNIEVSFCDGFNLGGGGEAAIIYDVRFNGILTATSATEATGTFDSALYARANSCTATENQLDCNDDFGGLLTSQISMDVTVGDTIFVFVDGFNAGGIGEVLFIEEPQAALGESCEEIVCIDSLFCDATNVCVPFGIVGDDCVEVPCEADLVCGETEVCGELTELGEDCAEFPCVDDLFCSGDTGVCEELGLIDDSCEFVPCAAGLLCNDALVCEAAGSCAFAAELTVGANAASVAAGQDTLTAPAGCTTSFGSLEFVGAFDATEDGVVSFDTFASITGDSVVWVTEGLCGDDAPVLDCNDDDPSRENGLFSVVTVNVTAGTRYFVVVETWASTAAGVLATTGEYVLTVTP